MKGSTPVTLTVTITPPPKKITEKRIARVERVEWRREPIDKVGA